MVTCRTCKYGVRKPFAKLTIFDLDKERMPYICEVSMRGETSEMTLDDEHDCIDFEPRETPLLEDALAVALEMCLHHVHLGDSEAIAAAQAALARYQREVGDA